METNCFGIFWCLGEVSRLRLDNYQKSSSSLDIFDPKGSLIRPPLGLTGQVQGALNVGLLKPESEWIW